MIIELTGVNDELEVYDDRILIKRKNMKAKFSGDKTIYLNQISGVEFKKGGGLFAGYIQFSIPGCVSPKNGLYGAAHDENSVVFNKKYNDIAEEVKLKIENLIKNQSKVSNPTPNDPDILRKYKQLFDDGIITQEDFDAKKKEILGL